jgi:hypothetical protein
MVWHAVERASRRGVVAAGDLVVVVAGFPPPGQEQAGASDVLRVVRVR